MSQLLLDDTNAMNGLNPFVVPENFFPSGTSKHTLEFQKYKPPENEPEQEEYKSPACDVLSKGVGRPGFREEECALSRPLLPGRNIDRGFTNYEVSEIENAKVKKEGYRIPYDLILISILILLIAVL